jgi:putative tricarboxylic transport membrane protein
MSNGDPMILVERPISAVLLILAVLILLSPLLRRVNKMREVVAKAEVDAS